MVASLGLGMYEWFINCEAPCKGEVELPLSEQHTLNTNYFFTFQRGGWGKNRKSMEILLIGGSELKWPE